jgi:hypothetical protein
MRKVKENEIQMVIDDSVCRELLEKGHFLLGFTESFVKKGRYVYLFYNTPELERDLKCYDSSTYYPNKKVVNYA